MLSATSDYNVCIHPLLSEVETHLQYAHSAVLEQDWLDVIYGCLLYLKNLPISPATRSDGLQRNEQFREFAGNMMKANHDYDSVLNLFEINAHMISFISCYFRHLDKKGVQVPAPEPTKEEAMFAYQYCIELHNLIASKLS